MITTDTHVYFYSGSTIYSNWHRTHRQFVDPVNDNLFFNSTEQAFMWWKAVFFQDHDIAARIEKDYDPASCKRLGRNIKGYDDRAWECVRLGYMTYVNYLKYSQNPAWAEQLKATGNRVLVEASPVDRIWGIGLSVEDAAAGQAWRGRNLLGEALMTVRGLLNGYQSPKTPL